MRSAAVVSLTQLRLAACLAPVGPQVQTVTQEPKFKELSSHIHQLARYQAITSGVRTDKPAGYVFVSLMVRDAAHSQAALTPLLPSTRVGVR